MSLKIHFLNVGHGDCTIIDFPSGDLSMVDINVSPEFLANEIHDMAKGLGVSDYDTLLRILLRRSYSFEALPEAFKTLANIYPLTNPLDYLASHFSGRTIFRFIASHPDMDHLAGLRALYEAVPIVNFWYAGGGIEKEDFDEGRYDLADWELYQKLIISPTDPKALNLHRGDRGHYWTDDGVEFWSPTLSLEAQAVEAARPNLASYVHCIRYGEAVAVLGGDAEAETWEDIYGWRDGEFPKVGVLKASHHGRRSGYHQPSVKAMSPELTVVSVGKKPPTDASQLYDQYSQQVLSTRYHGNIVVTLDETGYVSYESDRTLASADDRSEALNFAIKSILAGAFARQ